MIHIGLWYAPILVSAYVGKHVTSLITASITVYHILKYSTFHAHLRSLNLSATFVTWKGGCEEKIRDVESPHEQVSLYHQLLSERCGSADMNLSRWVHFSFEYLWCNVTLDCHWFSFKWYFSSSDIMMEVDCILSSRSLR